MKANLLTAATLLLGAFAVASCGDTRMIPPAPTTPPPAPAPPRPAPWPQSPPRPAPLPQAPRDLAWQDAPVTPGNWQWNMAGGQSVARFAGGRLVLHCDPAARTVRIERSERGAPLSGPAAMTIKTQAQVRALSAVAQAGAVSVALPARDPLLDAMALSRGRFAIEVAGLPALYVPSWTEVSRVVEDCR